MPPNNVNQDDLLNRLINDVASLREEVADLKTLTASRLSVIAFLLVDKILIAVSDQSWPSREASGLQSLGTMSPPGHLAPTSMPLTARQRAALQPLMGAAGTQNIHDLTGLRNDASHGVREAEYEAFKRRLRSDLGTLAVIPATFIELLKAFEPFLDELMARDGIIRDGFCYRRAPSASASPQETDNSEEESNSLSTLPPPALPPRHFKACKVLRAQLNEHAWTIRRHEKSPQRSMSDPGSSPTLKRRRHGWHSLFDSATPSSPVESVDFSGGDAWLFESANTAEVDAMVIP